MRPSSSEGSYVWDRGVRAFHWMLVASVAAAGYTGFFGSYRTLDVHLGLGGLIGALIVFRLVWGIGGTTHARFANFVPTPASLLRYMGELLGGRAPVHVGHNPLGAAMIVALLATLLLLTATGLLALGGALKDGPLAPFATFATGAAMRRLHELAAYGLAGLVVLHVAGVLIESLRTRVNLIGAMVSGSKPAAAALHDVPPVAARRGPAALATGAACATIAGLIAYGSLQPALGVPAPALDAGYAKECGACHSPHHPSLAPAATWAQIMAELGDHFGDNASLEPPLTQRLGDYLAANAAERWDTLAAHRLRERSPQAPLRITATSGWRAIHSRVADAAFNSPAVAGRQNCSQCHADAESGRFARRRITVPDGQGSGTGEKEKRS